MILFREVNSSDKFFYGASWTFYLMHCKTDTNIKFRVWIMEDSDK